MVSSDPGNIADHQAEKAKPSEKQSPTEKTSNTMRGDVNNTDREKMNSSQKEERNPEKRLSRKTAGRSTFGECAIDDFKMCGKNKDVVVKLNNGLPEKIDTNNQSWQRDGKNPQIWHINEGNQKFDLKADVRMQGNDVTAKVKYENGREISYKNGEPNEIKHPNGEKWTADAKHPGTWEVTKPNPEDPAHPHHTTIKDVQVNVKDGDIKWHVDRGVGAGHDREIDAKRHYHDNKPEASASKHPETVPLRPPDAAALKAAETAAHQEPAETAAHQKPPETAAHQKPPETSKTLPTPQHLEKLEPVPIPQPIPARIESTGATVLPTPQHLEKIDAVPIPQPIAPHVESTAAILPSPQNLQKLEAAPIPQVIPHPVPQHFEAPAAPMPPAPETHDAPPQPQPIRPNFEMQASAPKPPELHRDTNSDRAPTPSPKLESSPIKSEAELKAQVTEAAAKILPKVATSSFQIPSLSPSALAERPALAQAPLPVGRPALLGEISLPAPSPINMSDHNFKAPEPSVKKTPDYFQGPGGPVDIPKASPGSAPEPVPLETSSKNSANDSHAIAPVRAGAAHYEAPVAIVPSIPKPEPAQVQAPAMEQSKPAVFRTETPHTDKMQNRAKQASSAEQDPESSSGHINYKPGMMLNGSAQTQAEKPMPYQRQEAGTGTDYNNYQFKVGATENQHNHPLQGGAEAHGMRPHPQQHAAGQRLDANEGFLVGGGQLDAHNKFEIPPGALSAGAEQGHQVIVEIYNYQSGKPVHTGEAIGRLDGAAGSANRTLVITGPGQWAGRSYNLQKRR